MEPVVAFSPLNASAIFTILGGKFDSAAECRSEKVLKMYF